MEIIEKAKQEKTVNSHELPAFVVGRGNKLGYANDTYWLALLMQTNISCTNQSSPKYQYKAGIQIQDSWPVC